MRLSPPPSFSKNKTVLKESAMANKKENDRLDRIEQQQEFLGQLLEVRGEEIKDLTRKLKYFERANNEQNIRNEQQLQNVGEELETMRDESKAHTEQNMIRE